MPRSPARRNTPREFNVAGPRLWRRRRLDDRQGPHRAHRRERGVARRRRARRAHAREPSAHGGHDARLQGRRGAGRLAVPPALRRQDHVQRSADRAGGRRGVGDRAVRGVAGARRIRRSEAHATDSAAQRDEAFAAREAERSSRAAKPRGSDARGRGVRHEARILSIPTEHHNPMELYASTAVWDGDGKLTVYDKTPGRAERAALSLRRVRA